MVLGVLRKRGRPGPLGTYQLKRISSHVALTWDTGESFPAAMPAAANSEPHPSPPPVSHAASLGPSVGVAPITPRPLPAFQDRERERMIRKVNHDLCEVSRP